MSLSSTAYQIALRVMFRLPPERIHGIVMGGLRMMQYTGPAHRALKRILAVDDDVLAQNLCRIAFPRPLGLAAGFDKGAFAPDVWASWGFGYAELGTITASPQPGNPAPRLFRLKKDRALLNRMGFNNPGAAEAATNLRRRRYHDVIGINIGKTKVVPLSGAVDDYRRSASILGPLADYMVVNVSSPNTPGLRDLQAVESLRPILHAVMDVCRTPVFVKIAPDLSDEDVDAVADLACELGLAGIVATNTTISRNNLQTASRDVDALGAGGISGPPVAARSLEVLRRLHHRAGKRLILISVGGIDTAEQAWERIAAGASLLQGYTGLIYGGPEWIRSIHRGLAEELRRQGFSSISEAVGCEREWIGPS